jgi:hypothetical protein
MSPDDCLACEETEAENELDSVASPVTHPETNQSHGGGAAAAKGVDYVPLGFANIVTDVKTLAVPAVAFFFSHNPIAPRRALAPDPTRPEYSL